MKEHRPGQLKDRSDQVQQNQELLRLSDKIRQSIVLTNLSKRQRNSQWLKGRQLYGKIKRSIDSRLKYCIEEELMHQELYQVKTTSTAKADHSLTIDTLTMQQGDRRNCNPESPHRRYSNIPHGRKSIDSDSGVMTPTPLEHHTHTELNAKKKQSRTNLLQVSSRHLTINQPAIQTKHGLKHPTRQTPYILQTRSKNDRKKYEMINKSSQRQLDRINFEMSFLEQAEKRRKQPSDHKIAPCPVFFNNTIRVNYPTCLNSINYEYPIESHN